MNRQEIMVLAPHRDDAVLTFGGRMLQAINEHLPVTVHLVYGRDGYLQSDFYKDLLAEEPGTMSYLRNLAEQAELETLYHQLAQLTKKGSKINPDEQLTLGIFVRTIEEKACMKYLGVNLVEHGYNCGYPLRGYTEFNGDNPKDIADQIKLISEEVVFPLARGSKAELYFPSGIGGHPDHRILSRCGLAVAGDGVKTFFGQDMPYANVREWFGKSDLPLERMATKYIDISPYIEEKLNLLTKFYQSQLTQEDIRVVRAYHLALATVVNRDYAIEHSSLSRIELETATALECYYTNRGQ